MSRGLGITKMNDSHLNPFVYESIAEINDLKLPDLVVPLTQHYGQRGEDLIVKSILDVLVRIKGIVYEDVWYLEIGANHPIATSATFLLYKNGARGVLVEANPTIIEDLVRVRPGDKVLNTAVVGLGSGKAKLFVSAADELSTLIEKNLQYWPNYPVTMVLEVDTTQISDLLKSHYPNKAINFLSIDCEGPDFEILERIDLDLYPFNVIQVEPSNHINANTTEAIVAYLALKGYVLISATEVNCIFVRVHDFMIDAKKSMGSLPSKHCSFDVFDTLITRRFKNPQSVLLKFCLKYNVNFEARIEADNGSRSLEEIYLEAGIPLSLMEKELEEEIDNLIGIKENIMKVNTGDILVSDMYLNNEQLRKLLHKFNLHTNSIYVSNSDKATGKYWQDLRKEDYPLLHYGDNLISDYRNALNVGVRSVICNQTEFTEFESSVKSHNEELAYLLRELRLTQLDPKSDKVDTVSHSYNLPLLFAFCQLLSLTGRNLVFLGRDCLQLYKIYSSYFGDCSYLQFSRDMLLSSLEDSRRFLRSTPQENPLFVDLISTGATWTMLKDEFSVMVLIYINDWSYFEVNRNLQNFKYVFTSNEVQIPTVLELLNPAPQGRLLSINLDSLSPETFGEHELSKDQIEKLSSACNQAITLREYYTGIADKIEDPRLLAESCLKAIYNENEKLASFFKVALSKEASHLSQLQSKLYS